MVCVYAPTWDCPNFITTLFSLIPCLDTHHLILGGDLNLAISPKLDKSNPKALTSSNMARALITLTDQINCVDAWRSRHPTTKEFSFYLHVHRTYSRIDYFFLDKILLPSVKLCEYSSIVISDHAPLIMDMELLPRSERHLNWSLNTRLLSLEKFCNFSFITTYSGKLYGVA